MRFHYRAFSPDGTEVSGKIEAASEANVLRQLKEQSLVPIEVNQSGATAQPWYRRDIQIFSRSLNDADLARLCRQLATLFKAELPTPDILEIARLSETKRKIQTSFEQASRRVSEGQTVSEAFEYPGHPFAGEFLNFLRIGDASNSMAAAMTSAADYFATRAQSKEKVSAALLYPMILVLAGIGLLLVIAMFLVPTLLPLFRSAGVEPPTFFVIMASVSKFVRSFWPALLIVSIGLPLGFSLWKSTISGRMSWQSITAKIPVVGGLILQSNLEQIANSIALLVQSGFALPEAFRLSAQSTSNHRLQATFADAAQQLELGETALNSLKSTQSIPVDFLAIVDLAERTNQWPEVLGAHAEALKQRNEDTRNRILTLITPVITVVIGLLAGAMIYTVMGALLEINAIAAP